ncbi:hypothetical protein PIB30_059591 [Stylosanthes scabra]|uniref:Uncharacterized protein n=1 Tax=Stylosanthes scabra TaxID=79078 RepID=A0ABU6UJ30_9FABA|nr:hypothetical protein [Stylosanthes scabra]
MGNAPPTLTQPHDFVSDDRDDGLSPPHSLVKTRHARERYPHPYKATASLGHAHLWTRILESLDFDLTRERVIEPSKVNAIVRKNINQTRRNLLGPADEGGDDEDEAMEDVPPIFEARTSSQVPTEAEAPPQFQSDYAELIQRGFDDMRTLMSEGFTSLSDHMDRLNIRMTSQSVEIQDLRGELRSFRDSFQRFGHQGQQDPAPGQD